MIARVIEGVRQKIIEIEGSDEEKRETNGLKSYSPRPTLAAKDELERAKDDILFNQNFKKNKIK